MRAEQKLCSQSILLRECEEHTFVLKEKDYMGFEFLDYMGYDDENG
ncbi:hypothetical protein [Kineothrix alysoides]|nr:hypothetical protein [Kineothrix alysoides]